jgi:hypothetical protein
MPPKLEGSTQRRANDAGQQPNPLVKQPAAGWARSVVAYLWGILTGMLIAVAIYWITWPVFKYGTRIVHTKRWKRKPFSSSTGLPVPAARPILLPPPPSQRLLGMHGLSASEWTIGQAGPATHTAPRARQTKERGAKNNERHGTSTNQDSDAANIRAFTMAPTTPTVATDRPVPASHHRAIPRHKSRPNQLMAQSCARTKPVVGDTVDDQESEAEQDQEHDPDVDNDEDPIPTDTEDSRHDD